MTAELDNRILRILSVTTSYPRHRDDFAGHFVHALNAELVARGHEVTALAPHAPGLATDEERDGVRIVRFRYGAEILERVAYGDGIPSNVRRDPLALLGLPGFAAGLRAAVRSLAGEADVVHANWAPTAALAGASFGRAPVVLTLHGSDTTLARKGGVWRRLLASGIGRASRVVTVARAQSDFLVESGLLAGPATVIPSGVDAGLLDGERLPRRDGTPFTYVYAGRLVAAKGVSDLLEAFSRLARTRADVRLIVVGGGAEEGTLRELAQATAPDKVRFTGALPHERAADMIAAADAFVLPSHGEGSPLSVTEALALGTPVIGTRVGAVPDLLGSDGLVVEPRDVAGLAGAMQRLADDAGLRERLSREGRERVAAHYTWPKVAQAYERLFRVAAHG